MRSKNVNIVQMAWCVALSVVFFLCCFLLWGIGFPEYLSYQEQYQLFLFTSDYFIERVSVVGGMADYLGEFVTQFFYSRYGGAIACALTLTIFQALTGWMCLRECSALYSKILAYSLSFIPSAVLVGNMFDENMLMSFPVALIFVVAATLCVGRIRLNSWWLNSLVLLLAFIVVYWLGGGAAFLIPVLWGLLQKPTPKILLSAVLALVASVALVLCLNYTVFVQMPENRMFLGINYYRVPGLYPSGLFVAYIALAVVMLLSVFKWGKVNKQVALACVCVAVPAFAFFYIKANINEGKTEVLKYDWLVRNQKWHEIVALADANPPQNNFCLQAVNLALAMTGQLTERMFDFDQKGIESLIAEYKMDNTSCLVTAEVFYHLGMINSALRYNFDLQEAIMNDRKSGRLSKRIAECLIINGYYDGAKRYLNLLENSLHYGKWARNARNFLNDEAVSKQPDWRQKRNVRFKSEMLYQYPEIEKMLGLLAVESEGANPLAWEYFCAALLLKNDLTTLSGTYHFANEKFGRSHIPRNVQQALAMFWTFGHQSFDGIPFPISPEVKKSVADLAVAVSRSPGNPGALKPLFSGNYCVYFLEHMQAHK